MTSRKPRSLYGHAHIRFCGARGAHPVNRCGRSRADLGRPPQRRASAVNYHAANLHTGALGPECATPAEEIRGRRAIAIRIERDYWCERVDCAPPVAVDGALAGVESAEPTALPPFDPGVEICACVFAPVPALAAGAEGEANAPPTALPPFDPGVEICACVFALAPVLGAGAEGEANAPPTALPPFDPGVEIWTWAHAADAVTIKLAAIRNDLVMSYLQFKVVTTHKFPPTRPLAQSHLRKYRERALTRVCSVAHARLPTKSGRPVPRPPASLSRALPRTLRPDFRSWRWRRCSARC